MEGAPGLCYTFIMKRAFSPLPAIFAALTVLMGLIFTLPLEAEPFSEPAAGAEGRSSLLKSLSLSFRGTLLIIPEDNGPNRGAPLPVLPSPGAALGYPIWGSLSAELSLDMYFTHYGYDFELNRAIPIEIENRSAFVFGSILGLQAVGRIPLRENMSVRVYGGPAADLRIVVIAADLNAADLVADDPKGAPMQTDAVREYFWGQGRWIFPFLGTGLDYGINSKFLLGLDFRVWFPMYRLWTGEDLPAVEGWRFGVGFKFTVR
ncbi:hypothetical protein AGMMS50268_29390 [Spirochaetia bacterium]|nr:hypothetical protein AGMMS50268_29390 [Spirochaetia bacterium]